jgi:hypothetical protein
VVLGFASDVQPGVGNSVPHFEHLILQKRLSPRSKTLTSLAFCRQLRAFIGYEAIRSSPVRGLAFETGWAAKAKWLPSAPCKADEKSP